MSEAKDINQQDEFVGQSLVPVNQEEAGKDTDFIADFKAQADELGQKFQETAAKAKDFATEKFGQASEKFKELQAKDPKELVEDAKEYARQKPGQTILISAAVGLVLGLILRGGRK